MNVTAQADRDAIATADGCPDNTGMKSKAENKVIRLALKSERVNLMVRTEVTRLLTSSDGRRIVAAEARHHGRIVRINLSKVLVAAGAVNSAALLLRSATKDRTHSLGNSSVRAVTCGFSGALLD